KVKAVVELMPYSGGLKRNIVQCLDDFGIPLKLAHTVTNIKGKDRLEGISIAKVDENRKPIKETEEYIPCDTLLLSVGLVPENELSTKADVNLSPVTGGPLVNESLQTNIEGVFACGNVLHVHDLVDFVTEESINAGKNAAKYLNGKKFGNNGIELVATEGARYTVPTVIDPTNVEKLVDVRFRVGDVFKDSYVSVYFDDVREMHIKKRIIAPGEMETVKLTKALFDKHPNCKKITVKVEGE
ncbi:NAD(P)/FAD-dependent oxidoreductase, partial [Clostridium haemolyticum]